MIKRHPRITDNPILYEALKVEFNDMWKNRLEKRIKDITAKANLVKEKWFQDFIEEHTPHTFTARDCEGVYERFIEWMPDLVGDYIKKL